MTPDEIIYVSQEIDKTEDWTYHKKAMYGIYLMGSLTYPNTVENVRYKGENLLKVEYVRSVIYEIINKLIQFDEIQTITPKIEEVKNCLNNKYNTQIISLDISQCSTLAFGENIWIQRVDNERSLALVVTGGIKGRFILKKVDGVQIKKYNFFFYKNGVYILPTDILNHILQIETIF